ncbi:MAG: hypothetical protein OHK0017_07370 [Patescibacteria group bacterium]
MPKLFSKVQGFLLLIAMPMLMFVFTLQVSAATEISPNLNLFNANGLNIKVFDTERELIPNDAWFSLFGPAQEVEILNTTSVADESVGLIKPCESKVEKCQILSVQLRGKELSSDLRPIFQTLITKNDTVDKLVNLLCLNASKNCKNSQQEPTKLNLVFVLKITAIPVFQYKIQNAFAEKIIYDNKLNSNKNGGVVIGKDGGVVIGKNSGAIIELKFESFQFV